ncbi:hypothetical protein RFI_08525 [Reticulomyxa filosa]|uniref:Uncharacterized protein n=1 Tax=Reticulomyxa filosa TaxID=46433 RepID=X6NTG9_RETFI|nr:hypothetical protein RFI_08525 [Reticulomyxa filosa]|eukprot:ETO28602.1 hypothetical protein RFI_08525 [Reticulomyxa filosa]
MCQTEKHVKSGLVWKDSVFFINKCFKKSEWSYEDKGQEKEPKLLKQKESHSKKKKSDPQIQVLDHDNSNPPSISEVVPSNADEKKGQRFAFVSSPQKMEPVQTRVEPRCFFYYLATAHFLILSRLPLFFSFVCSFGICKCEKLFGTNLHECSDEKTFDQKMRGFLDNCEFGNHLAKTLLSLSQELSASELQTRVYNDPSNATHEVDLCQQTQPNSSLSSQSKCQQEQVDSSKCYAELNAKTRYIDSTKSENNNKKERVKGQQRCLLHCTPATCLKSCSLNREEANFENPGLKCAENTNFNSVKRAKQCTDESCPLGAFEDDATIQLLLQDCRKLQAYIAKM